MKTESCLMGQVKDRGGELSGFLCAKGACREQVIPPS